MEAKKYKFVGSQKEADEYGENPPIIGEVYSGEVRFGSTVGHYYNIDDCANNDAYGQEWEEVVEERPKTNLDRIFEQARKERDQTNSQTQPAHYKQGKVECIEAIKSAVVNKTGEEAVLVGNVIKYLWRYESKGGITDVEKAIWYINHLKQLLDESRNKV
jgi:hypothetical protein